MNSMTVIMAVFNSFFIILCFVPNPNFECAIYNCAACRTPYGLISFAYKNTSIIQRSSSIIIGLRYILTKYFTIDALARLYVDDPGSATFGLKTIPSL